MKPLNTVFLVEDELDIMQMYTTALKAADVDVVGLPSGKDAMAAVKSVQERTRPKPKLVLLDLVLPVINGLEILYSLREHEVTKDIPVFILSNYNSDALRSMSAIRPDKYLVKVDTTPSRLVELVTEQLKMAEFNK